MSLYSAIKFFFSKISTNNNIKSIKSAKFTENHLSITEEHLNFLNESLSKVHPQKILEWAIITLPGLYQTTAFGLTGLVITDMISKISYELNENESNSQHHLVPLIFLDTLYHFQQTLDLTERVKSKYNVPIYVYKPVDSETTQDFERLYGQKLWEVDEDSYDYLVKVEPSRRAYQELGVSAVITGRRRSQKGDREKLEIIEIEDGTGLIKINPLAHWDFSKVQSYVKANEVPYNTLIDQGYRSIGDWHSTKPINDNTSDERSGRWQGQNKTECGLHKDYFKMRSAFIASQKKRNFINSSNNSPIII